MKNVIIKECKKYGYILYHSEKKDNCIYLNFKNDNVREELQFFSVEIDKDLERVTMAIIIDLGSWNEALESDLNDIQDIKENIGSWLSENNLKLVEEWLNEE